MNLLVITHGGGCQDGLMSALIFKNKFPNCDIYFERYGRTPPNVKNRDIILVDFSYKKPEMLKLIDEANSVIVLDHHKSAEIELEGLQGASITFDMKKSGAMLAHDYAYPHTEPNWLTSYVQDRDLWEWKLPNSKEIHAALGSYPMELDVWNEISKLDPNDLVTEGKTLLRKDQQIVQQHIKQAQIKTILGHEVPVVNATVLISEIGEALSKNKPFACMYYDSYGKRHYSLRSNKETNGIDVSLIAGHWAGGGHFSAAACSGDINKFIWS